MQQIILHVLGHKRALFVHMSGRKMSLPGGFIKNEDLMVSCLRPALDRCLFCYLQDI